VTPRWLARPVAEARRYADLEPFEVFMSALCVVAGLPLVFDGPAPGTLEQNLPLFIVKLWGVELAGGGILTLLGLALTGTPRGTRIERSGLAFLATASGVYALVLMLVAWPTAVASVAILVGFAGACLWRRSSMKRTAVIHIKGR
jgi:hypothetical protein